jgi:hypothetical protein
VRRPDKPTLALVGDLTYAAHLLEHARIPGVGNRRVLRRSTTMMNQLRAATPGLIILPTHDPCAASTLGAEESKVRSSKT